MEIILDSQNKSIIRIDKGEECLNVLKSLAKERNLSFNFSMIGACSLVELGFYDLESKKYFSKITKTFEDKSFEILSVSGNAAWYKDEPVVHAHGVFADENYETFGGHVAKLVISITGEAVIDWLPEKVFKKNNSETGLKLLSI